ncbi:hypothetical protein [Flavobacterium sp.]|uniref:hypothetical protein n=1 Tax=Flavobacterium sp. TaxID=239 RepID=UPI002488D28D|nr:hypothetical protein [Flavobacterium sp.]MDI1317321.1 hypothetical protein [Flavobacterium sp.]
MDTLFKMVLSIHIIAGSIGLFTGTINIIRKKGDKQHVLVGKFFFYGMILNAIAGFIMSIMHHNIFLLIIAVFSFYLTATGQRFLSLKKLDKGQKPKSIDWILTSTMILFALFFIIYGVLLMISHNNFGIVLLVFGMISLLMARKDIALYRGKIKFKNYWLLLHIQRMIGAYIAALTAFLVVNNTYLPSIVAWLMPTVILTPLIFYWSRKYAIQKSVKIITE